MTTEDQTATTDRSQRKSLAVDQATYDLLNEVCFKERHETAPFPYINIHPETDFISEVSLAKVGVAYVKVSNG